MPRVAPFLLLQACRDDTVQHAEQQVVGAALPQEYVLLMARILHGAQEAPSPLPSDLLLAV